MLLSTTPMVVLHLISRYRWTGSAEPAVTLCAALAKVGVDARLCCIPGESLERAAAERGVRNLAYARLERNYTPWGILATARALARAVERERIDLIHAHTQHDAGLRTWRLFAGGSRLATPGGVWARSVDGRRSLCGVGLSYCSRWLPRPRPLKSRR